MSNVKRAFIDSQKCDAKTTCPAKKACPAGAITRDDHEELYYVAPFCVGCRQCLEVCPRNAIIMI
ncbi:MAG: ATP-binding protein [Thermincolia bacterium]